LREVNRNKRGLITPLVIGVSLNYKSLYVVQKVHGGSLW